MKLAKDLIQKFRSKNTLWEICVILILSLIPLLWLGFNQQIVIGHDAGFPIEPIDWTEDRIHTWSESQNWGQDNSLTLGSLFVHAPEYLLSKIGIDIFITQRIVFIFWSALISLSMYAFLSYITVKKNQYSALRIFGSTFYLINYYVLQAWFIAERTKFSILIALPLVLLFLFRALKKKNIVLNSGLAAIMLTIFNGGGSAFTLYGGLFLVLGIFFISFIIFFKAGFAKTLKIFGVFALFFGLFNSYWIIPQIYFSINTYGQALESFGGIDSTVEWARLISQNSSIINVMRLQGIPDWYDNSNHPFSNGLLSNPFFQIISWVIPILAFLPLYLYRKNKNYIGFIRSLTLLAIVSILFTSGMHFPFGIIYEFLLRNIPFFTTYRTPFYKFGYALWFSYAILIGFSINYLASKDFLKFHIEYRIKNSLKKISISWSKVFAAISILILLFYTSPYLQKNFFQWHDRYTTLIEPPEYIFEFSRWAEAQDSKGTTLLLPRIDETDRVDKYNWGYSSIQTLPSILTDKPIASNNFSVSTDENESKIIKFLYQTLEQDIDSFDRMATFFNIDSILLRKDVDLPANTQIKDYNAMLSDSGIFELAYDWGEWQVYNNQDYNKINNVEITDQIAGIYSNEELNLDLLLSVIENIDSKSIAFNPSVNTTETYELLDTSKITSLDSETNSSIYRIDNRFDQAELQIKRQDVDYSNFIIDLKREGDRYTIRMREPNVNIKTDQENFVSNGRSFEQSFDYAGNVRYISLNSNIFEVANLSSEYKKVGKMRTLNSPFVDISYFPDAPVNILNPESFANLNWEEKLANCGGVTEQIAADQNASELMLSAINSKACVLYDINDLKLGSIINFSFDVKKIQGLPPSACLLEDRGNQSLCIVDSIYEKATPLWTNISHVAKLSPDANRAVLHLYATSGGRETISSYRNLNISSYAAELITSVDLNEKFEQNEITKFDLSSDVFSIEFITENAPNPLNKTTQYSNSFEVNTWGSGSICGEYNNESAQVNLAQSTDATDGEYSLNIESLSGKACLISDIPNFSGNVIQKLSFDYKNVQGFPGEICMLQGGAESRCFPEENFEENKSWINKNWIFRPDKYSSKGVLHLYSESQGGLTSNLYDNLRFENIDNPFSYTAIKSGLLDTKEIDTILVKNIVDTPSFKYFESSSSSVDNKFFNYFQKNSDEWILIPMNNELSFMERMTNAVKIILKLEQNEKSEINFIFNGWEVQSNTTHFALLYRPQVLYIATLLLSIFSIVVFVFSSLSKKYVRGIIKKRKETTSPNHKLDNLYTDKNSEMYVYDIEP